MTRTAKTEPTMHACMPTHNSERRFGRTSAGEGPALLGCAVATAVKHNQKLEMAAPHLPLLQPALNRQFFNGRLSPQLVYHGRLQAGHLADLSVQVHGQPDHPPAVREATVDALVHPPSRVRAEAKTLVSQDRRIKKTRRAMDGISSTTTRSEKCIMFQKNVAVWIAVENHTQNARRIYILRTPLASSSYHNDLLRRGLGGGTARGTTRKDAQLQGGDGTVLPSRDRSNYCSFSQASHGEQNST